MATAERATLAQRLPRLRAALPWLAALLWAGGAAGVWLLARSRDWSPGELVLAGCAWLVVGAVAARETVRGMFGPVFTYELTRLGRRELTFMLRLAYVLGILGVLAVLYFEWLSAVGYYGRGNLDRIPSERLAGFATDFFYYFSAIQYGVVVLLTPVYVAGTIADEKERKTLEFLLATDLRNREIIFGKVAARVTNLLMYVLAGLPVIAFMQLFGGIDPEQLLAVTAATVLTVVGLSSVSVAFSVALRRPRDAIALTYLALLGYGIGSATAAITIFVYYVSLTWGGGGGAPPLIVLGYEIDQVALFDALKSGADWLAAGNPVYVVVTMTATRGGPPTTAIVVDAISRYAIFWGIVTALSLGYAVWRLRAVALHQSYGAPKQRGRGRAARAADRRPVVGDDPMLWKEVFVESGVRGGCLGWFLGVGVIALVFIFPILFAYFAFVEPMGGTTPERRWKEFTEVMNGWCRVVTGVLGFLLMMAAAVRGAGAVSGERDRDTWVSLMSTPLTAWEMLRAKWLGCLLGLRRGALLLVVVWTLTLAVGAVDFLMIVIAAVYLVVFVSAFAWVGLWNSIASRTTLIATVRAIMLSLFLAGGFWVFLGLCCGVPIEILFRGPDARIFEYGANLFLGCTPPFVMGWMPLMEYDRSAMGPFHWDENHSLGPLNPVVGFFVWVGVNCAFGLLAWRAFVVASNRSRDTLAATLPRRYDPTIDDDEEQARPG